jgi:RES domain-containing protein
MAHTVWRIAVETPGYGSDDLTGKGAEKTGGRWNRRGTPVVYASASIALAYLETIVNLTALERLPLNRYLIRIHIPLAAWKRRTSFDASALVGWDALPAALVSLDWGTGWLRSGKSLIAEVPSIVVPEERNILINPRHSDARELVARKIRRWNYDARLR